jgi:hypothetical protein
MTSSPPRRSRRRKRGRPKGTTVSLDRDRQRFEIAALWGFHLAGAGLHSAAYWSLFALGGEPIARQHVDALLNVSGSEIKHTSVTLTAHVEHLVRKARRAGRKRDRWLAMSALAIKAVILAIRTSNVRAYCAMLDQLVDLGWSDPVGQLRLRIVEAVEGGDLAPVEGQLGQRGGALLAALRLSKKPQ